MIPVIDIFAGPGGLGEGFSSYQDKQGNFPFRIALSIEMEEKAHQTLTLRAFYRQFREREVPENYYEFLRGNLEIEELYKRHPKESKAAKDEALNATLGEMPLPKLRRKIEKRLGHSDDLVLIGGPPCQAYSLAGRARNRGIADYEFSQDVKTTLYKEYLQVIADFWPSVFVMENVKGLLSASDKDQKILNNILTDLSAPAKAVGSKRRRTGKKFEYKLYPVTDQSELLDINEGYSVKNFLVECENYGIPQARHRVFIMGIREDIEMQPNLIERANEIITTHSILADLPRLRSGFSRDDDNPDDWNNFINKSLHELVQILDQSDDQLTLNYIGDRGWMNQKSPRNRGGNFIAQASPPHILKEWFFDERIQGVCNHETKAHMKSDLMRYLFCSFFGAAHKTSPKLRDFPEELLPDHKNITGAKTRGFEDRFRVQVIGEPAKTITSHIAKDGHYYIHYDPTQCRSLTVREAARIQTFPDNYFFCGNRTSQYQQVGNAVPPLFAKQIARVVADLIERQNV